MRDEPNKSDGKTTGPDKEARARSTIEFPYNALDDVEQIAKGVRDIGATACDWDQLAAQLKYAAQGGGFRVRMLSAKIFGLITYDRGRVELTDNGIRIVDPRFSRAARAEAFLGVPLYKAAFEKLKGQTLPPSAAIERLLESIGVAPKQKDKARQAFMRSAKHAGFMDIAPDRLTLPPNVNMAEGGDAEGQDDVGNTNGNTRNEGSHSNQRNGFLDAKSNSDFGLHPFIRGLLDKLPTPESDWATKDRAKWLQTAANIFDLIYTEPNGESTLIEIKAKREDSP